MKKKIKVYDVLRVLICLFVLFLIVFPFVWLILSTFKLQKDIIKWPPTLWPKAWTIKNYIQVWSRIPLADYIKNTVIFAGVVSVCSALLDSMAGYAFARLEFKGKEIIFNIVLLTMLIPFQIIMIPLYLELHTFGILNTYIGLILPRIASAYGMFFMRSFYIGLPKSLEEAARIDGAGNMTIMMKIVVPLSKATIAVVVLFYAVGQWNSWFNASIFLQDRSLYPLQLILRDILIQNDSSQMNRSDLENNMAIYKDLIKYCTTVIATLPILCIYPFVQKYFVKGVMIGSVKG